MNTHVAVIGAGVSGLVAAKTLVEHGFIPVVFERKNEIGGLWFYDESSPTGNSPCYASLRTNTSKYAFAYSDYPMGDDVPNYPGHADIFAYLCDYVEHFALRQYIQFGTTIQSMRRIEDGWEIVSEHQGKTESRIFERVIVGSGRYQFPNITQYPGQENFTGTISHSMDYTVPDPYFGKRVVVVGAAASAVDIAAELGDYAARTILAARHLGVYLPNETNGRPADFAGNRLTLGLPNAIRSFVLRFILKRAYETLGVDFDKFPWYEDGLELGKTTIAVNTGIMHAIGSGKVIPRKMFTEIDGSDVIFPDGSRETVDAIIYATGFDVKYTFLPDEMFDMVDGDFGLYHHVFHPKDTTIAFTGTTFGAGAIPPLSELQARWICAVWTGRSALPSQDTMVESIRERQELVGTGKQAAMRVNLTHYTAQIAGQFGAMPGIWQHRDLWKPLLLGPMIAAHYRLNDPGTADAARAEIERVYQIKKAIESGK